MTETQTAIPLDSIRPSTTNPRKTFDEAAMAELVESVRRFGVLQPILVRPNGKGYELVAGERRLRASKTAGLVEVPAVVRELTDLEALELQVVENLHRADLHPMEEAEGYEVLRRRGYSVEDLAAKVGKSTAYVYGRLKLCALCKEARESFAADRFTAGHAVILARLPASVQRDALDPAKRALFEHESVLWHPESDDDEHDHVKVRSVREFQAWVDKSVRFRTEDADRLFEPETSAAIEEAEKADETLLPITWDHQVPPQAREGRTWTSRSWKRADGEAKSKTCEHSRPAIVVIGPGRGDAFRVCTAKKKCKVHWAAEQRDAKRMAGKGGAVRNAAGRERERWEKQQARETAKRERWDRAVPVIAAAVAAKLADEPTCDGSLLAKVLIDQVTSFRCKPADVRKIISPGTSAEDLVRFTAFCVLYRTIKDPWFGPRDFPKTARAFGIDVKKIVAAVDREHKAKAKPAAKKKASKKKAPVRKRPAKRPAKKAARKKTTTKRRTKS